MKTRLSAPPQPPGGSGPAGGHPHRAGVQRPRLPPALPGNAASSPRPAHEVALLSTNVSRMSPSELAVHPGADERVRQHRLNRGLRQNGRPLLPAGQFSRKRITLVVCSPEKVFPLGTVSWSSSSTVSEETLNNREINTRNSLNYNKPKNPVFTHSLAQLDVQR